MFYLNIYVYIALTIAGLVTDTQKCPLDMIKCVKVPANARFPKLLTNHAVLV